VLFSHQINKSTYHTKKIINLLMPKFRASELAIPLKKEKEKKKSKVATRKWHLL
jgi:hypothetical protein